MLGDGEYFRIALNAVPSWESQKSIAKFVSNKLQLEAGLFRASHYELDVSTYPSIGNRSAIFLGIIAPSGMHIKLSFSCDSKTKVLSIQCEILPRSIRAIRFLSAVLGFTAIIGNIWIFHRDVPVVFCIVGGAVICYVLQGIGSLITSWLIHGQRERVTAIRRNIFDFLERNRNQIEDLANGTMST